MAEDDYVGPSPDELLNELPPLEIKRPHLKLEVGDIDLDEAARKALGKLSRDQSALIAELTKQVASAARRTR